jgi:hypothetical protein
MNIDQQIQVLIDQAPQYGENPVEVQTIAPALKTVAGRLKHLQYYVLQTLEQNWFMTTLAHRTQPNLTKTVVYAFSTLEAAKTSSSSIKDSQAIALPIPAVHILFQMLAMKPVSSVVFFETAGDSTGTEISRQNLQDLIQQYLQTYQMKPQIPPDIA